MVGLHSETYQNSWSRTYQNSWSSTWSPGWSVPVVGVYDRSIHSCVTVSTDTEIVTQGLPYDTGAWVKASFRSMEHWVSAGLALSGAKDYSTSCHREVYFAQSSNGGQNLVKMGLGGIRTYALRKGVLTEKAQWDTSCITQNPNTLPTRLCRRLVKAAIHVVCIRACWVIPPPFPTHCFIGPKFTVRCHGILWPKMLHRAPKWQKMLYWAEKLDRVQERGLVCAQLAISVPFHFRSFPDASSYI